MKKIIIIVLVVLLIGVISYFALLYHARMNMTDKDGMINPDAQIGEDGEYFIPEDISADGASTENMVDGDFTYVDNDKLLERIVGDWVSDDGIYQMCYQPDCEMTITQDGVELLATRADFVYLQPGEVTQTEFTLTSTTILDKAGDAWGEVEYCYHFLEDGEDAIYMEIFLLAVDEEGNDTKKIQWEKVRK